MRYVVDAQIVAEVLARLRGKLEAKVHRIVDLELELAEKRTELAHVRAELETYRAAERRSELERETIAPPLAVVHRCELCPSGGRVTH